MADDKDMVLSEKQYQSLYSDLDKLINQGRARAQSAMNRELMLTYWNCGKRLDDEKLTENGGYGTSIMERLEGFGHGPVHARPVPMVLSLLSRRGTDWHGFGLVHVPRAYHPEGRKDPALLRKRI
jgi:hypothetical protein